jgi:hypothetical protein
MAAPLVIVAMLAALLALVGSGVRAGAQTVAGATWLDQPVRGWNAAGVAVPAARELEAAEALNVARCGAQERAAVGLEEEQLAAGGWRLLSVWPTRAVSGPSAPAAQLGSAEATAGRVTLTLATASYDGMCRPVGFNAFVFVDGRYAGTLAPEAVDSRSDGVFFAQPALLPGGQLEATFTRYAPSDPLCCPSRAPVRVSYALEPAGGTWVVVPERVGVAPGQFPSTGGGPDAAGVDDAEAA